ncbi:tRNA lysidine(34) synthetase TilS [Fulvivirga lutea]|uniref:tRNA(Ile)-lysidine synthase n=1 Tax=Fulvivirga lutea TaxID=2810512 RepID=A0A975A2V9_9BACT|nr:tRNA lysidine(34) synthetase TilS [Fulvivirga lutea]QSE98952.1 tRNA lysidine(34) synthetase TilS [Fulvivirga lutea]
MVNEFLTFVNSERLFKKTDKLLVAVSGGKDSVVLVHLLNKLGFNFSIAHCNFRLRGNESDGDEVFVKGISEKMKVAFYSTSFDTKKYASNKGVSTQMAARELRYNWFDELMKANGFNYLLTAHHLNDSFETALFNFVKGTGVAGLRGIKPKHNYVIRPLINFPKSMIDEYAVENAIEWREDSSNESSDYHRNYLRHEVVPKLKSVNENLLGTYQVSASRLSSLERLLQEAVKDLNTEIVGDGDIKEIPLKSILRVELVVLEEYLKPFGFNFQQCQSLKQLAVGTNSGKIITSTNYQITVDRETAFLTKISKTLSIEEVIDSFDCNKGIGSVHITFKSTSDLSIARISGIEKVDLDKLKLPMKVRSWREGDSFQPLGMKGKKKLSDFMIDEKIPLNLKSSVLVLESDGQIVSVIGYRIDDRFKLTNKSKKALQIQIVND